MKRITFVLFILAVLILSGCKSDITGGITGDITGGAVTDNENANVDDSSFGVDNSNNDGSTSSNLGDNSPQEDDSEETEEPQIIYKYKKHRGSSVSGGDNPAEEVTWEEVYSYSDEYSNGGFFIDSSNDDIQVSRAYVWRAEFGKVFNGKIKVVSSNDKYSWYGSRLALVDPSNTLIRYEIRLLPSENKVEVKYVDRTDRTGNFNGKNENTISELLDSTDCNIDIGTWYYVNIIKNENNWKAQVLSLTNPTCFVEWKDDKINQEKLGVGIQSAGKYVVSRFNTIIAV